MPARIVVPLVLALAALSPGGAAAVPCSPLDCGPSAQAVAGGTTLAVAFGRNKSLSLYDLGRGQLREVLDGGVVSADGSRVVSQEGREIQTKRLASDRPESTVQVPAGWTVAGTSADGRRVVVTRTAGSRTSFAVGAARLTVAGSYTFDGLRGDRLYLIEQRRDGYLVRVASLATGKLAPQALKDAGEPALIQGQAWSRIASPDGRYVFTLYIAGDGEAMIHVLDMARGTARCVDLPGKGNYDAAASYALALSPDGRRLYAAGVGYGHVVTVDVARRTVVRDTPIGRTAVAAPALPSASLTRDGTTLAFATNTTLRLFDLATGRVTTAKRLPVASAVAYDARGRLWAVARDGSLTSVR